MHWGCWLGCGHLLQQDETGENLMHSSYVCVEWSNNKAHIPGMLSTLACAGQASDCAHNMTLVQCEHTELLHFNVASFKTGRYQLQHARMCASC
jgi:hypothetical protein